MNRIVVPTTPAHITAHSAADTRLRMLDESTRPDRRLALTIALQAGQATLIPVRERGPHDAFAFPGNPGLTADFDLLLTAETHRLAHGHVYYVDDQVITLAERLTRHTSKKPYDADTDPPTPYGVMFFERPIDVRVYPGTSIESPIGRYHPDIHFTAPTTAITWGPWNSVPAPGTRWVWNGPDGLAMPSPDDRGTWVTYYAETRADLSVLPPDMHVLTTRTGTEITAAELAAAPRPDIPPLVWENETALRQGNPIGGTLGNRDTDTTLAATWAIVHVWRLIRQMMRRPRSTALSLDTVERPRPGRRRDQRHGATHGTVRRIRVTEPEATTDPVARTGGPHRSPEHCYSVAPFERNHCMNPRKHTDGGCEHETITVVEHVRGPRNTPLKPSSTVHHIT